MEQIGLYLGCNIPLKAPDIEQSIRQIFPALGIQPVDLQGASCCPAGARHRASTSTPGAPSPAAT